METLPIQDYNIIYNAFSFTFAVMMAATLFFWLNLGNVAQSYRPAIVVTGLVTFIAAYHYLQIFTSFEAAYAIKNGVVSATGKPFNDAYRYVDWLLTVPLLLIELILVMKLSSAETFKKSTTLGIAAAIMVILGYPGEIANNNADRIMWWVLSMIPFLYIVYTLFFGLRSSISSQPKEARELVSKACYLTVLSWSFYPIVYLLPLMGFGTTGSTGVALQIGYSIADIIAKAGFGLMIFAIARAKSQAEGFLKP